MITKAVLLAVLVLSVLGAPWLVDRSFAAAIPDYFDDEWVGFACLNAVVPGGSPTAVLLQLNFDKIAGGGITLARATTLFARITTSLGWLSQITGMTFQVTCAFTPSQVQASNPGLTARQAALQLAGSFQQLGFPVYLILDSFPSLAPPYLGSDILILRTDAFRVVGPNNLSYFGSSDVVEPPG